MSYVNTNDLADLLSGSPDPIAADLGVDVRTVRRWKSGTTPPPPIVKLLRMRYGDLSGLLGPEWEGFYIGRDGLFYMPGWKYGRTAHELRALFFNVKEIEWYRREFDRMKAEISALRAHAWAAKKVAALDRRAA
jgi:hypothetical protein